MQFPNSPLARTFSKFGGLTPEQLQLLERTAHETTAEVGPRQDIIVEGKRPRTIKIILEGWVARYKQLPDGKRQILGLMIPGDICDANAFVIERMDHSLGALTRVRYGRISREDFEGLLTSDPAITRALWCSELTTASIQREWTANIGQRQARARIAHLFCEMHERLRAVGLSYDYAFDFPLTQSDIGEATGLTSVHVNRVLQTMRKDELVELHHKWLHIVDLAMLRKIAMFDPAYLHGYRGDGDE